jgi:hypothetical protein
MRTILFVLYIVTTVSIIGKQQGIEWWLSAAFFAFLAWVASKEESIAEEAREKRDEKLMDLLREIQLNQRSEWRQS